MLRFKARINNPAMERNFSFIIVRIKVSEFKVIKLMFYGKITRWNGNKLGGEAS